MLKWLEQLALKLGCFIFGLWMFQFAVDYSAVRLSDGNVEKTCENLFKITKGHYWFHLAFPGWGNACIDRGYFPKPKETP